MSSLNVVGVGGDSVLVGILAGVRVGAVSDGSPRDSAGADGGAAVVRRLRVLYHGASAAAGAAVSRKRTVLIGHYGEYPVDNNVKC
jgi:hypothetical protein